jgi:hypothetical protein
VLTMAYNTHSHWACLSFGILKTIEHDVSETISVPSSGEIGMRHHVSKGPNKVGVSLLSSESADRSSFRNVLFYSF